MDQNQALVDNQAFLHSLNTKGVEKAASAMTDFVRVKIREASFARKILPPKPVTSTDLVQSLDTDQPMRIVEMDRISEAYPVTFLEQAHQRYYKGIKFPVYYQKFMSEEFYKPIEEIMMYRVPIKTLVQENYLKDLQIAEDKMFIDTIDRIIADREAKLAGDAVFTTSGTFTPAILAEGMKKIISKEIPMGTILINELDFVDLLKLQQNAVGSSVIEDIVVNGFSYTKLLGHTFIRTTKMDVVKPGSIYLFTTPEFLGVFDILTDVKAYIEQKGSHLRFHLYETIGISFGNVNGVAKIVLQ
jgi:hypothetical protein